jgi:hypothetical protein
MAKFTPFAVSALIALLARPAAAQIKQPGAHPKYSLELEPHLTVEWDGGPAYFGRDGVGLGLRASIPLFHNGPIDSINDSMAISFGLDWVHFSYDRARACHDFRDFYCDHEFSANAFWLPVTLQWNFFVHKRIRVFGEVGLAIVHTNWSWARPCPPGSVEPVCEYRESDTDFVNFVFYPGARFMLSDSIGLTLRIGYPHLPAGASFLF